MKPTRDGYGQGLLALGEKNPNVVVMCADLTESTRAHWFRDKYPERFFQMGVSEQNMFGAAAGLALTGKIPYASTFGIFASGRAWEQIRVAICYMKLNVKIGGSHGGITVGADGATHQAIEEISLMRTIPNMTVIVPSDIQQAKTATIIAADWNGPVYFRLGRCNLPHLYSEESKFEIGKAIQLRDGCDITIIACGVMVYMALETAETLKKQGIQVRVLDLHTVKPIDEEAILKAAMETGVIVTAEEHTVVGGMGSAVCEVLSQKCPVPVRMVGIKDTFGESGEPDELLKHYGLSVDNLIKVTKEALTLKK